MINRTGVIHLQSCKTMMTLHKHSYKPKPNDKEFNKTHFGVWMSFCSLAACRQGCTTSSSLISKSRIPLFSTTLAPSSLSSFQNKKTITYWNVLNKERVLERKSEHIIIFCSNLKKQRKQKNSCCQLRGLGQCCHLSGPFWHRLCVTGCQRFGCLNQHICCLPHLHKSQSDATINLDIFSRSWK